jgi:anti-sigma factor RsiW
MSDPETLPAQIHPEAALLPWYENGTLRDEESRQVAAHLATCASCRSELEELQHLKTDLIRIYEAQSGPSVNLARSVLDAVTRDSTGQQAISTRPGSWMEKVDQWFRSLFVPRWVPTLAVMLLMAQVGLLLWLVVPTTRMEEVTTRSLGMQTARVIVAFQAAATDEQIRSLLITVRARIIDGPAPDGRFTIEIPAADAETVRQTLELLRGRPDVVRSADRDNK